MKRIVAIVLMALMAMTCLDVNAYAFIVREGDTFWKLHLRYHVSWNELQKVNASRLRYANNPNLIFPGQKFILPNEQTSPSAKKTHVSAAKSAKSIATTKVQRVSLPSGQLSKLSLPVSTQKVMPKAVPPVKLENTSAQSTAKASNQVASAIPPTKTLEKTYSAPKADNNAPSFSVLKWSVSGGPTAVLAKLTIMGLAVVMFFLYLYLSFHSQIYKVYKKYRQWKMRKERNYVLCEKTGNEFVCTSYDGHFFFASPSIEGIIDHILLNCKYGEEMLKSMAFYLCKKFKDRYRVLSMSEQFYFEVYTATSIGGRLNKAVAVNEKSSRFGGKKASVEDDNEQYAFAFFLSPI